MPESTDRPRGMLIWLILSAVIVAIDQLTKWMAESSLELGVPIAVMPHLNWMLAYNEGAAFSMLSGARWFFVILGVVVAILIIYWLLRTPKSNIITAISLAMILGGAIGNWIDRLVNGRVIDFIDFYADIPFWRDNWHFATFNIADIAITLGAFAYCLVIISGFETDD